MKSFLLWLPGTALALYIAACTWLYFKQETLLLYPQKLPASYQFRFLGCTLPGLVSQ
jgi:hypothetical protein